MKNKRKFCKKLTSFVIALLIICSSVTTFADFKASNEESAYMKAVVDMLVGEYKFDADEVAIYRQIVDYALNKNPELLEGMIKTAADGLDKFSGYYSEEDLKAFLQNIDNEYVGIGVTISRSGGYITIEEVLPNGPAFEAGLLVGDKILSVGDISLENASVNDAVELVRGEAGVEVTLKIKRGEEILYFDITRKAVSARTSDFLELENEIGYIVISNFNSQTPKEVEEALSVFDIKGIKNVIIDVRNNPGGELASVINTASLFVPGGKKIMSIDYKAQGYDLNVYSKAEFKKATRKTVVLVNENSASAAEVLAGALMYNDVAVTVGMTTYGKGTVQEFVGLYDLPGHNLGDIKLTVAEYLLPNDESINQKGIKPTYKVKNTYEPFDLSTISPILYEKKYTVGDRGEGVLAIEQRLKLLGYLSQEADEVFDEETKIAVNEFQKEASLFPYGVADMTTQSFLDAKIVNAEVLVDNQLLKAIELLTNEGETK